jgi:hypothetical protein
MSSIRVRLGRHLDGIGGAIGVRLQDVLQTVTENWALERRRSAGPQSTVVSSPANSRTSPYNWNYVGPYGAVLNNQPLIWPYSAPKACVVQGKSK